MTIHKFEHLGIPDDVTQDEENRAKLVRADFTQTIEAHWKSRALEWNRVV